MLTRGEKVKEMVKSVLKDEKFCSFKGEVEKKEEEI